MTENTKDAEIKRLRAALDVARDVLKDAVPFIGYHADVPEICARAREVISKIDEVMK